MAWIVGYLGKLRPRRFAWQGGWRSIVNNKLVWVMLFAVVIVTGYFLARSYMLNEVYPTIRDEVLRTIGIGFYPVMLWAILLLVVLRLKPRWLVRSWRWWFAAFLMICVALTTLGGFNSGSGIMSESTLGGVIGEELWGPMWLQGMSVIFGLCLLSGIIVAPRYSYYCFKAIIRSFSIFVRMFIRVSLIWLWATVKFIITRTKMTIRAMISKVFSKGNFQLSTVEKGRREVTNFASMLHPDKITGSIQVTASPKVPIDIKSEIQSTESKGWRLPPIELFDLGPPAAISEAETDQVARNIEEALGHHGVQVSVDHIKPGPTVTLYGLTPGWISRAREIKQQDDEGNILRDSNGRPLISRVEQQTRVKVDSILAREKDMALSLAAPSLRIQAPVPGESVVGIEVPNRNPVLVTGRTVMQAASFLKVVEEGGLALALGQGSGGDPIAVDLRKLPHLLIAGATGSGKSVCINTLIVSLMSRVSPERLRVLLIDPKRVELTPFNGLPHLVAPVVVDTEPSVRALKGVLQEMFVRYRRMEEIGVRNIEGYLNHSKALEPMPYLVVAIDELADLMMTAPYEIEQTICRLAQLGRATGIHLIVATQRPSVDVVTGLIKANFPSRISFAVVSQVDSRTILDSAGAERLLGKGDMLFLSKETPKPQRIQGAFVSDSEIATLGEFWRNQDGPPLQQFDLEPGADVSKYGVSTKNNNSGDTRDEMTEKAIELASRYSQLSTSLLQRRLRIGYPRAARLMDQLEDEGIIAPGEPGKSREVLGGVRSQDS